MSDTDDNDSNLSQEESVFKDESFAQMVGLESEEIEIQIDPSSVIEPDEVSTKSSLWGRVGARTVVIAGATLLGVLVFAMTGRVVTEALSSNKQELQKVAQQPKSVEETKEDDIGALKTSSALAGQKAELEKLNSKILTSTPSPAATITPTIKPSVQTASAPATKPASEPRAVSVPRVAYVTARTQPQTAYEPAVIARPVKKQITPASAKINRAQLPPQIQPKPQTQAVKEQPQPQLDTIKNQASNLSTGASPSDVWQAAANAGVYIASDESNANQAASKTEKQTSPLTPASSSSTSQVFDQNNGGQSLIVGTRANARLESTIVLFKAGDSSQNTQNQQTYPIKLTQSLKNPNGGVPIPKGSLLITQVKSAAQGWLELSVVSIVIGSKGSNVVEKPVAQGVILVQAEDGSPLVAEITNLSETKDDVATTSRAVDYSLPVRHSIPISANSEGEQDSPSSNNRYKALERALQRNKRETTANLPTFTLKKGTSVRVYVNRSFNL